MYETIKKFLADGGKCLLIENGKPVGVVLTMEEYELLKSKLQITRQNDTVGQANDKLQTDEKKSKTEQLLIPRINSEPVINSENPVGEAMVKEIDFPEASADLDEINLADAGDVTLEDLGLDELPY